jgi:CO/xanthine dehydrogenase Mo-binding subunit
VSATVEQLFTEVGRSVDRRDADAKMRGEAAFAGDVEVPRMLHGKVLRSEVAHARILRIETTEAEAMPGVVCVMTGGDLHGIDPYYGHALKDRPLLALDRVRFAGEPVAAVAAETEAEAEAALRAIVVEYDELPLVGTLEDALAEGAPRLHEGPLRPGLFHGLGQLEEEGGNVCYRYRLDSGSVEGAGAEAAIEVEGD